MYYIALLAPDAINEDILRWKHFMRDRFGCIVALKSPAHITLISPFWMKTDLQSILDISINEFASTRESVSISLKNFDCFKPRVIFVQVERSEQLNSLKNDFEKHLSISDRFPIRGETRSFHPHITIANRDLHKKDFIEAWEYFKNKTYPARFVANGITLLQHSGIKWEAVHTAFFPLS